MNTKKLFIIGLCMCLVLPLIVCVPTKAEDSPPQSGGVFEAYYESGGGNGIPYEGYRHSMGTAIDINAYMEANRHTVSAE